jgi:agmatine deiminase
MPAEWEEHDGTWLSWPKDPSTFPGHILQAVEEAYARMVGALKDGEEVHILVDDSETEARVNSMLKSDSNIVFHRIRTVDVWVRDYAPIYVKGRDLAVVKWVFNAWGNKYDDLKQDSRAGDELAESTGLRVFRPGLVLEGGSIDVNGKGSMLTTEQCLLNPNRNQGLGMSRMTEALRAYLSATNLIWLGRGIEGDDTDGHVDDIARFVAPGKVLAAVEKNPSDPNHEPLDRNLRLLMQARNEEGRMILVEEIPMPERMYYDDGRLPASHLNFYIGNKAVLVPIFGGRSDGQALKSLEDAFPSRDVVGIDCRALVHGLGSIHCVTQQIPRAPT